MPPYPSLTVTVKLSLLSASVAPESAAQRGDDHWPGKARPYRARGDAS
jgi:hypothetical protein